MLSELHSGWHLTSARTAGDEVVEVVLKVAPANHAELQGYGLSENIIITNKR